MKDAVKPADMIRDHDGFLTVVDQVHKLRSVAVGGVLKASRREQKREYLPQEPGEEEASALAERLFCRWTQEMRTDRRLHGE